VYFRVNLCSKYYNTRQLNRFRNRVQRVQIELTWQLRLVRSFLKTWSPQHLTSKVLKRGVFSSGGGGVISCSGSVFRKLRQTPLAWTNWTETGAFLGSLQYEFDGRNPAITNWDGKNEKTLVNNGISTTNLNWWVYRPLDFKRSPTTSPPTRPIRSLPLTKSSDPRLIIKREPCCKHRSNHESFLIKASANAMQTEEPMTSMIWKGKLQTLLNWWFVSLSEWQRKNRVSSFNFLFHGSLAKWVVNDDPFPARHVSQVLFRR